ncbi:MAG TPA: glycosyltransferase [Thermoanaerobaculia bacterium]|nr:glycosyltransferase [Thermoanaerobaculia bacterium]
MTEIIILSLYVLALLLLFAYSVLQLDLALRYRRSVAVGSAPAPADLAQKPVITVQLPIYNELHVAERIVRQCARMRYPREKLQIQVLDDSTDDTTAIVARAVEELRNAGHWVEHVRRGSREGFKAGALRDALPLAQGELVAIFDADFLPAEDFLDCVLPHFQQPEVGAVQTKWGHLNEEHSMLTRLQAFMLEAHFTVEQAGRCASGYFLNFNGTAGIWRKSAILDAGSWSAETLTEDVDLSHRAQRRGWKIHYVLEHISPAELPIEMGGVRSQQYRWMKGGSQNARRHLPATLRAQTSTLARLQAMSHLLSTSVYVVLLAVILLSIALAKVKNTYIEFEYVHYGMFFFLSTGTLGAVYFIAQRSRISGASDFLRFLWTMLCFLVFTLGLTLHNSIAVLQGWTGHRSAFVRTPKYGGGQWHSSRYARKTPYRIIVPEVLLLSLIGLGMYWGFTRGQFALYPIQIMASCGLIWVITRSFMDSLRIQAR